VLRKCAHSWFSIATPGAKSVIERDGCRQY
jgi:hypothetical protein